MHWSYRILPDGEEPIPGSAIYIYHNKKKEFIGPYPTVLDSGADGTFFPYEEVTKTFGNDLPKIRSGNFNGSDTYTYSVNVFKMFEELSAQFVQHLQKLGENQKGFNKKVKLVKIASGRYRLAHDCDERQFVEYVGKLWREGIDLGLIHKVEIVLERGLDEYIIGRNFLNMFPITLDGQFRTSQIKVV